MDMVEYLQGPGSIKCMHMISRDGDHSEGWGMLVNCRLEPFRKFIWFGSVTRPLDWYEKTLAIKWPYLCVMSVLENKKLSSPSLRGAYQSAVACFRARGQTMYGSLPPIRGSCGPDPEVNLNPPSPPGGSPTQMPSVPSTRSIPCSK